MNFDVNVILTGLAAPCAVLLVKTLLDFSLSHWFVKYLSWLPVRGVFRERYPALGGRWEQIWEAPHSPNFEEVSDRHSHTEIKQFGRYIYAEFYAKDRVYCLFGVIKGMYVTGEWYDKTDRQAYFGSFQVKIFGEREMDGLYVGHSRRTSTVESGAWKWKKFFH